jgi:hypothetical protein
MIAWNWLTGKVLGIATTIDEYQGGTPAWIELSPRWYGVES